MPNDAVGQKVAFRHGMSGQHPRLTIGISLAIFCVMCALAVFKAGDWVFVAGVCGLAVLLYANLAYIKLEIWESGFSHRDLSGNHAFEFVQIDDVLFETVGVGDGYAPVLSVRLKGGIERMKISIGMFPIRASALLFTEFERHRVPIHQDWSGPVQRKMRQISDAQSET